MRYILNHMEKNEVSLVLSVRAASSVHKKDLPVGTLTFVSFEDGSEFSVKVNKESISVWPQ